jgi:hypothetical protein
VRYFKQKDWRSWSQWIGIGETQRIVCCECLLVHKLEIKPAPLASKFHYMIRVKALQGRTAALRKKLGFKFPKGTES